VGSDIFALYFQSGAESIMCLKKVLGGLALGWAALVLAF